MDRRLGDAPKTPRRMTIDFEQRTVELDDRTVALFDPLAYDAIAEAYTLAGWAMKATYTYAWMGRPAIQLPDDLVRLQEFVYAERPDVIVETGIAHGGSVIFYASLCKLIGHGRVIGIDVEIRPHNRTAIEAHPMNEALTMIEGSSIDPAIVARVHSLVGPNERVFLVLDSAHDRAHVEGELEAYASLVKPGGYIAVADGIMRDVAGLPRTGADWAVNNPASAVAAFLVRHPEFVREVPARPFDESSGFPEIVTNFRSGWLRRRS
jgi:cephalosporin hydroxylase